MTNIRKTIEQLKEESRLSLQESSINFKKTLIKKIIQLYRRSGSTNLKDFSTYFLLNFKLTDKDTKSIISEVNRVNTQITTAWNTHFEEDLTSDKYDKFIAVNSLDLSSTSLETDIINTIKNELNKAITGDYSFDTLRKKLEQKSLGTHEAYTLANTTVAAFDNNYMTELAQQSGVLYYIYDGITSTNTRPFCQKHVKRVYTLQELSNMNNGQGLPVTQNLGGYNCQHYLTPLIRYNRIEYGEIYNPKNHF